jgi:hypothetical protein
MGSVCGVRYNNLWVSVCGVRYINLWVSVCGVRYINLWVSVCGVRYNNLRMKEQELELTGHGTLRVCFIGNSPDLRRNYGNQKPRLGFSD